MKSHELLILPVNHGVFFVPKSPEAPWRSPTAKERVRHLDEARGVALCADLWEMWRPRLGTDLAKFLGCEDADFEICMRC